MNDTSIAIALVMTPISLFVLRWVNNGSLAPIRLGLLSAGILMLIWLCGSNVRSGFASLDAKDILTMGILFTATVLLVLVPRPSIIWVLYIIATSLSFIVAWYLLFFKLTRLW